MAYVRGISRHNEGATLMEFSNERRLRLVQLGAGILGLGVLILAGIGIGVIL